MRAATSLLVVLAAALPLPVLGALRAQDSSRASLVRDLDRLAKAESIGNLPSPDSVSRGPRTIAAGSTVRGTVVARGPVLVAGRVDGSVVSLAGDVTVAKGGVVTGDALAVGGRVIAEGEVDGEMRAMSALPTTLPRAAGAADLRTPVARTYDALRLVAGTFGVLLIIAVGVLLFAGPNLDEVVATLERRFGRAFWVGLLGQVLILPALVVLVVALAVSVIGILLIPFAIVAYAIAIAGLVTLGFLAVARLVGGAVRSSSRDTTPRSRALAALAMGLAIFCVLWVVAAALTWAPLAATVVRAAAVAVTWTAMTLGLGAAMLSRAGTHRLVVTGARPAELASWQTPTPLTGVVAARRPAASVGQR
ncbi:MAG TPA: polymer-forming cytoskeletal protein [Gemmatimonadaceae bacterium]|nr:polymer-forming cytoskeletal protein [Gemmatimonadaceae bacterium]